MYYEDLSDYVYYEPVVRKENVRSYFGIAASDEITLLNIGWLDDATKPFRTGALDPKVIDQIATLCLKNTGLMRGFHLCRLCDEASPSRIAADNDPYFMMSELHSGQQIYVGNGEIWFRGLPQRGVSDVVTVYIAPTMLLHYIKKHAYLPPDEAIEALLMRDHSELSVKLG